MEAEPETEEVVDEEQSEIISNLKTNYSQVFEDKERIYQDQLDDSRHPSYTNFEIPYFVKCKIRYVDKKTEYNRAFMKQLKDLEVNQSTGYETVRFVRHLGRTTIWPPLHNRREIDHFLNKFFVHTPKDHKRLKYLLNELQT